MDDVCTAVRFAMDQLGVSTLKDKQKEAIHNFVRGHDCFVILPTGYGKTLCYALLPFVFDHLRKKTPQSSIVVCVSPLVSLMMDQVSKYSSKGLTTQFLGEDRKTILSSVECWKVNIMQLVFISPEALLRNKQWKQMLSTSPYRENLVALVVDEAHCVETW